MAVCLSFSLQPRKHSLETVLGCRAASAVGCSAAQDARDPSPPCIAPSPYPHLYHLCSLCSLRCKHCLFSPAFLDRAGLQVFRNSKPLLLLFPSCPRASCQRTEHAGGRKREKRSKIAKFATKNLLFKSKQQYRGQMLLSSISHNVFLHLPVKFRYVPLW